MSKELLSTTVYLSEEVSSITALAALPSSDLLHKYDVAERPHRILTDPGRLSCSRNAGMKKKKHARLKNCMQAKTAWCCVGSDSLHTHAAALCPQ